MESKSVHEQRIQTAVALGTPDQVPFAPNIGNFFALGYDVTIEECMLDPAKAQEPMERYLNEFDPDMLAAPTAFYPIKVMEFAKSTNMRWPGETHKLGPNVPYQFVDNCFLEDDQWDEFMADPTHFLLTKVLPKRYKGFEGLSRLNIHGLCAQPPLALAGAGIPPVKEALENLLEAARMTLEHTSVNAAMAKRAQQLGYPLMNEVIIASPFDEFAGTIRGLINTIMDLKEDPEMLTEAVTRWGDITIPSSVARFKAVHAKYAMIPLHCGTDTFMSPDDYETYYWPHLKRLIMALIEADITPYVFCEGQYNTRLDTIGDVPVGKVIYAFEQVDMKRAKEKLAGKACVAGNFPTANLIAGSEQQVIDQTKKLIDDCASGGGYIMTNSITLDNADHKLLRAWHEATLKYGVY